MDERDSWVSPRPDLVRQALAVLMDEVGDELWFCDRDGNLAMANKAAVAALGFDRVEDVVQPMEDWLSGLEIFERVGRPRLPEDAPLLRSLRGEIITDFEEMVRHPKTGRMLYREVYAAPIRDEADGIVGSVAVVRDITERREFEEQRKTLVAELRAANAAAREALAARNVLLAEVYHRTKNNLQTLDALIALEERHQGEDAKAAFRRARSRILAMSRVHQQLLESSDVSRVGLDRLVPALASDLALTHGAEERGVALEVEADPIGTDLEMAAPIGLLINELVTNAFKHGLADAAGGRIFIRVQRLDGGRVVIEVADSGTGSGASAADGPSAGLRIIDALCRQLRGEVEKHENGGTTVRVTVPLEETDGCPAPAASSSSRTTS